MMYMIYRLALFITVITFVLFWNIGRTSAIGRAERDAPLSSVIAITHVDNLNIPAFIKGLVDRAAEGSFSDGLFPLPAGTSDTVRLIGGLRSDVLVKWLDPLTLESGVEAPRFGANNDYTAYFGDGWDDDWTGEVLGSPPQFRGSGRAGWLWVNHEYVSNKMPQKTSAPTGQHMTLASYLRHQNILKNDVTADTWSQSEMDVYIKQYRREVGGSWIRVVRDAIRGTWKMERSSLARRFDASPSTLVSLVRPPGHFQKYDPLKSSLVPHVVVGILADCSGAQTPWGTIITAEENHQIYYGDVEICWGPQQKFLSGNGCDSGTTINFVNSPSRVSAFGASSIKEERYSPDHYGYLVEIDPRVGPQMFYTSITGGGTGQGHRKMGSFGRARWENATVVVDENWKLLPGRPIVIYAGNDRPSGRIYKWISEKPYILGMNRAEVRRLLDRGTLFVAHFEDLDNLTGHTLVGGGVPNESRPGSGRWIHLSVNSVDVAPNGKALKDSRRNVGAALKDTRWNGMGGLATDYDVRRALFTASAKIGIKELNRPEDLEWNANDLSGTPRLYVAFTGHTFGTQLDSEGRILADDVTFVRNDPYGAIFAIEEANTSDPSASSTFDYFQVWKGTARSESQFAAANPDNIMIDGTGGLWFGTDGNYRRTNGKFGDALYYLDLDPEHRTDRESRMSATYGKAFRIAGVPSDAEATGPSFNSDMTTIFMSVQHPGEYVTSGWPQSR